MPAGQDEARVHWRAPLVIVSSFVLAIILASAHHILYHFLDGTKVNDKATVQQTILASGTALAFLFRACLLVGLTVTYCQVFWWSIRRSPVELSSLDSLGGLLHSVFELRNFYALLACPALAALALLMWLLPLTAIIPPATLAVKAAASWSTDIGLPYIPDYGGESFAKFSNGHIMHMISEITMTKWYFSWYGYPTNQLLKTALSSAYQGTVLDMEYNEANATYAAQFYGPSVQCQPMPSEVLQDFNRSLDCDPRLTPHDSDDWCLYDPSQPASARNRIIYAYLSWLPSEGEVVPFGKGNITDARLPMEAMRFGSYKGGPASMFVANRVRLDADEWNVLNCSFYNASFTANFSSDASKRITPVIEDLHIVNPISASIADPGWTEDTPLDPKNAVIFSYMALMQCLSKVLYGTIVSSVASEIPLINEAKVQQPDVLITELGLSQELAQMRKSSLNIPAVNSSNWIFPAEQPTYPPDTQEDQRFTEAWPASDFHSPAFGRPLASAIEEMFRNMTLSLFSSPSFLIQSSDPVNVTTMRSQNIYVYSSSRLVISYVVALALALVSSICGLLAIRQNGASYSNRISTFLRVAVQQDLYSLIPPDDQKGADPLPRSVANAKFDLQRVPTGGSLMRVESMDASPREERGKAVAVVCRQSDA